MIKKKKLDVKCLLFQEVKWYETYGGREGSRGMISSIVFAWHSGPHHIISSSDTRSNLHLSVVGFCYVQAPICLFIFFSGLNLSTY